MSQEKLEKNTTVGTKENLNSLDRFPYFKGMKELSPIIDSIPQYSIRNFVVTAFAKYVPPEFWILPASMSGKFHPDMDKGLGGLVRHTKADCLVALDLFPLYPGFDEYHQSLILAALLLHDICKPDILHPIQVAKQLWPLRGYDFYPTIINLIESHMGQWDQKCKLPRPKTNIQKFVHLCDYIASRNDISLKLY